MTADQFPRTTEAQFWFEEGEKSAWAGVRRWTYGLTADEWLHLAAEGEDSEVGPCCANLSYLRECLNMLAISQGKDAAGERKMVGRDILAHLDGDDTYGHDMTPDKFPLYHKVLAGIRAELGDA